MPVIAVFHNNNYVFLSVLSVLLNMHFWFQLNVWLKGPQMAVTIMPFWVFLSASSINAVTRVICAAF